MKRLLPLLLAILLFLSAAGFSVAAEERAAAPVPPEAMEEGDDSDPMPIDMMDDEDGLEIEEEIIVGRVLQYGDDGDDVLALQTRLAELKY